MDSLYVYSSHGKFCLAKIYIKLRKKTHPHSKSLLKKNGAFKYLFSSAREFIWGKILLLVWKQLGILTVQEKMLLKHVFKVGVGVADITPRPLKITALNATTIYDM